MTAVTDKKQWSVFFILTIATILLLFLGIRLVDDKVKQEPPRFEISAVAGDTIIDLQEWQTKENQKLQAMYDIHSSFSKNIKPKNVSLLKLPPNVVLQAVWYDDANSLALINSEIVKQGTTMQALAIKVIHILPKSVLLEYQGEQVMLHFPEEETVVKHEKK